MFHNVIAEKLRSPILSKIKLKTIVLIGRKSVKI